METSQIPTTLHSPLFPPNTNRTTALQNFNFKPSPSPSPSHSHSPSTSTTPSTSQQINASPKNPRSIHTHIRKLARHNKLNESLNVLNQLNQNDVLPLNPTTFSSLIDACTRNKFLSLGRKIHTHILTNGLQRNETLRAKLVHMYTSCGAIEDAKELFSESPFTELGGTLVSAKKRFRDLGLAYSEMRVLGVEMGEFGFASVVKCFGNANVSLEGLKVHAHLIKNGFFDGSLVIKSCLVDMYCKCGEVELARKVFEESCERDDVLWGAMINGFSCNGMRLEALQCVRLMVEEGLKPNLIVWPIVLSSIGELCALRVGREVHAYVVKRKLCYEQVMIQSALIDMYCKCGDIGYGRRVLCSSMERNVGSWSALMKGYASSGGRIEQAMKSMIWMQREGREGEGFWPDIVTVATVLPIFAQMRALKQGKEIHAYALKQWFLPHVSIISSLMLLYSKCGVIEYSRKLFDCMERRNVILWTAMMDSYVENGHLYEALGIIRSMQLTENKPDTVTIARMLSVCSKLKLEKLGKEIHGQVLKRDFASVHYVSAELINMYGVCEVVDKAKSVFDAVPVKGSMTWTALIRAYGYKEWHEDAIELFDHMITNGYAPNHFTFEVVLSICDRAGFVEDAFRIFNLMSRYKIEASKEHCYIMIRLLTRYGKLDEALIFVEMSSSL